MARLSFPNTEATTQAETALAFRPVSQLRAFHSRGIRV